MPQVQHDAAHVLGVQLLEQPGDVGGRAAAAAAVHVGVERGQVDDAQAQGRRRGIGRREVDDAGLGLLILERDLVADQRGRLGGGSDGGAAGDDGQRDGRPLGTADQLDGARQRHVHDVDRLLVALRHGHDPVAWFQLAAPRRGPARQELANLAIAVLRLERGADTEEGQIHRDGQALHLLVAEIVGVGIVDVRQRVQVELQDFVAAERRHASAAPARVG